MSTSKTVQVSEIKSRNGVRNGVPFEGVVLKGHQAEIVTGTSIRLFGLNHNHVDGPQPFDITFKMGDQAACGSYNLTYVGRIVAIHAGSVTVQEDGENYRLDLHTFAYRNYNFNPVVIAARNADVLSAV